MEGLSSQIFLVVHQESELARRRMIDATNAGRVGFQLIDHEGKNISNKVK